jgi:CRISPR-associated protein Cmr4
MDSKILCFLTRTPLHIGAGASVGAIDQPIIRERHTGFPIMPASSLKGSFADHWNAGLFSKSVGDKQERKVRVNDNGDISEAAWLFGSDSDKPAFAGSLIFSEARVLAFPIRSAKGSYAWITCPLMLQRAARDGVFGLPNPLRIHIENMDEPEDHEARYAGDILDLRGKIVLEEYCFTQTRLNNGPEPLPDGLAPALAELVPDDALLATITDRLVILSNGMMSHFATTACEIAQHVRISDETGAAEGTGLFNQENVPADTLFYTVVRATNSRVPVGELKNRNGVDALTEFANKLSAAGNVFQFGGDASTGLGFCTVNLNDQKGA